MILQVLIVDDEPAVGLYLKSIIEEIPRVEAIVVVSGEEALAEIEKSPPQVAFLDIDMPGMNGLELAQSLAGRAEEIYLVFATAYPDYALQAFELYSFDYILKPFDEARIKKTIKRLIGRAFNHSAHESSQDYLQIENHSQKLFLEPSEIIYVESRKAELFIKTIHDTYLIRGNLNSMEKRMEKYGFFRSHRSFLVNLQQIKTITPEKYTFQITMKSGDKVMLSRYQEKRLRAIIEKDSV